MDGFTWREVDDGIAEEPPLLVYRVSDAPEAAARLGEALRTLLRENVALLLLPFPAQPVEIVNAVAPSIVCYSPGSPAFRHDTASAAA